MKDLRQICLQWESFCSSCTKERHLSSAPSLTIESIASLDSADILSFGSYTKREESQVSSVTHSNGC